MLGFARRGIVTSNNSDFLSDAMLQVKKISSDQDRLGHRPTANIYEKTCATQLRRHLDIVVTRLIAETHRGRKNRFQDGPEELRNRIKAEVVLLIEFLNGRADFGALYIGQRVFELTDLEQSRDENRAIYREAVDEDGNIYRGVLEQRVRAVELNAFEQAYRSVTAGLVNDTTTHVRTLFIGDCLQTEILSFLIGPLMSDGLSIEPFPINPRDPSQFRQGLERLATKQFDVVFFSPFSHARLPEIEALLDPRRMWQSPAQIEHFAKSIIDQTRLLLEDVAKRFECPIFVHNAGLIPRASNLVKLVMRGLLTRRTIGLAETRINQWLSDYITTSNSLTFRHLFLIDEASLVSEVGRVKLGRFLHTSEYQHAIVLSQRLAEEYRVRISAVGHLMSKKLVICDLDNTLWDGVIGEGAVAHFVSRQQSLKNLKDNSGVVLSIASKNDPNNVRFDGGVLGIEDFVAPQISWSQKSEAITKIKRVLNLQTKHMVFLDDRPDERAMIQESFPDLVVFDPGRPDIWKMIDLWCAMTLGNTELDRTQLYQQQTLRDAAMDNIESGAAADTEALKRLGLVISITQAKRSDLKRVAELINRTNQWNLCGSRTTFEQAREWHESNRQKILIAHVSDRFGDMGTVCAAVVTEYQDRIEIPVFVLSCRVFGYGVESAMLEQISKQCGQGEVRKMLVGRFLATTQNHPCRNMYSDHGFIPKGDELHWSGTPALPRIAWAEISVDT